MSFYLFSQQDNNKKPENLRASLNFHISGFLSGRQFIIACQARFDSVEFQGKVAIKMLHYACFSFVF